MSEMKGDHELNWHIDADTSVICRAQICLNRNDSVLEFRDKEGVHQLKMNPGEIWFINTGWNHRVVNGETTRRSAILGFHFDDLKNKDLLLL
jgi:streptogramin lyase